MEEVKDKVIEYLRNKAKELEDDLYAVHTHPDLIERVMRLSDTVQYQYGYPVIVNPSGDAIGFGMGTSGLFIKVSEDKKKLAIELGAEDFSEIKGFMKFDPWNTAVPMVKWIEDLKFFL